MSDARRNVRLYSTIKDRKSPLKGSRPSVPHGTNFFWLCSVLLCVMCCIILCLNVHVQAAISCKMPSLHLSVESFQIGSTLSTSYISQDSASRDLRDVAVSEFKFPLQILSELNGEKN